MSQQQTPAPATPATRPPQTPQQVQLNTIKALLDRSKDAISSRLPKHLTPDRIAKVALTAINKTPKLLECTHASLLASVMQAAELGLEPGGALGEGYLVPYNVKVKNPNGGERWETQAQFIPGYRGLISLARRSGQILSIEAHVVHDKDEFTCSLGLDPDLKHIPAWNEVNPGNLRFVYAVAKLKDGGVQFEVMSRAQIEAVRNQSKAGSSGPWKDHYEEMARKTVIRRLFKYLPVSVELATAMELDAHEDKAEFSGITIDAEIPPAEDGTTLDAEVVDGSQEDQGQEQGQQQQAPAAVQAQAPAQQQTRSSRADNLKAGLRGAQRPAAQAPAGDNDVPL